MYILLTSTDGKDYVVKKSDIQRVSTPLKGTTFVKFTGKQTSISIPETPKEFFAKLNARK